MRTSATLQFKVAVLGAAGGIGQPLSLILKTNPLVSHLSCYDIHGVTGVAADLSHICSPAKVTGHLKDELHKAVDGADVVIIPAGTPRKPGMTREDLFSVNATIVRDLVSACAKQCPKALIGVVSNPVNSVVPIASEVLKKAGVFDPARLFGITTLDVVRARTFVAEAAGKSPYDVNVQVVGGHSGPTIIPLLSQAGVSLTEEQVKAITHRVQYGGDEVVKAKGGAGSATLSMAYAAGEWMSSVLKGLRGDKGIVECTYVQTDIIPGVNFFGCPVELGKGGVEKIHKPVFDAYEQSLLEKCVADLEKNIAAGFAFGSRQ
ncbi:mitochondrial malate dehydrogenase, putative [Trypanosoma brucei gambiense DAL972]|uniref:Malate dehydrogenase n=3 Tax=Trypanozoon TaxID=39700 RepID=D0A1U1_TRYB9|nr:mitochondrial malate dehydrogenase, putative [Trypanosoma brucei gambiense DAL972]AAC27101.1 malate dehydrogenase [Trypanosoma brucei]CBH15234.1 mitochondrial malate dehydrogenase, putative [Trypanosoma brucei gambiense DAL972]|eukprot:XP_011777499.1 mitochondrial malate dehydrogenase, putative [Trypanosoma brucei gambiense DAL972]